MSYAISEQQRRRSACASAQSDQCLCYSLPRQNDTSSLYIRNFKILAGLCSWIDQFVSCLVGDSRSHIFSWRASYENKKLQEVGYNSFVHRCKHLKMKWAASWQNQQSDCAPSEDSDKPGHPPSLIRVYAVRMKKPWALSYPLSAQRRLWSDWADAQADLSLRCAHIHFVGFVVRRLILFQ